MFSSELIRDLNSAIMNIDVAEVDGADRNSGYARHPSTKKLHIAEFEDKENKDWTAKEKSAMDVWLSWKATF